MIRIISLLLSVIAVVNCSAVTADNIIEKFVKSFESAKSLTMRYTMTVDGSGPVDGIMCLRGEKFKINSAPIAVWYDGTTQWTYTSDSKEVSITEPTPEEIADINPFVIINSFRRGCKSVITDTTTSAYTITMTPIDDKSGIRQAVIKFSRSDSMPLHLSISLRSGGNLSLSINSVTRDINYQPSTFVFNKDKYPDCTIVDLR